MHSQIATVQLQVLNAAYPKLCLIVLSSKPMMAATSSTTLQTSHS